MTPLLWLAVLAATQADPGAAYRACPGNEALAQTINVSWTPGKSALADHSAFRGKLGMAVPAGDTRILWFGSGGDLATTTLSVIAVRKPDGIWHVDGIGQEQSWIKGSVPRLLPRLDRDLTASESKTLDRAIADPCLLGGPTFQRDGGIAAGGLISTLEVEAPAHHWVGGFWGALTPQEQAIINLIGKP